MKTVFIPPILDWSFLKQLPQQIASQFARNGYRVIFCNNTRGEYDKIEEVEENLFVYHNKDKVIEDLKYKRIKADIFYNTFAKNLDWANAVNAKTTIYHSCDVFRDWANYEVPMIKRADVVLCTSQYIYDIRKEQHENVHLVRNACASELIDLSPTFPDDLVDIEVPRFLFAGAVGEWVSTYLIKKIAEKHSTVLVGKEFGKKISSNVINLGVKPHSELINYYSYSDVGLIPFRTKTEITQAANPIKVWEYLACGLPVLATSWAEMELPEFKDIVFTADTDEEFISLADKLSNLTEDERRVISEKAIAVAKNNTWEKRFEYIKNIL